MPKIPLNELKKDMTIRTELLGEALIFKTTWGLFCPEEIDAGTKLLLSAIGEGKCADTIQTLAESGQRKVDILDIGCGYGPIGLSLAKAFPYISADLVDKDFVAVEYAEKNAKENTTTNVQTFLSNGFSHVPTHKKYDLLLSNLPAKVSKEFFWILFGEAEDHIKEGGYFIVVVIKQLEIMVRKNFNTIFGNSDVVARDKTYSVVLAKKKS